MELILKMPVTKDVIKEEIAKFESEIQKRQSEIKMLSKAVAHYQSQCDHKGQQTGHNERDGSWGNACPTCGYSY